MKLLFIFKSFGNGGVASVMIDKLNYLANQADFEIHILSEFPNNKSSEAKLNSKITIHVLDLSRIISKKRLPVIGFFQLIKEVKVIYQEFVNKLKPDVITGFNFGYYRDILPFIKTSVIKINEFHGSYQSKKFLKKKKDSLDYLRRKSEALGNLYDYGITLTEEDLHDRNYLCIPKKFIYNSIRIPDKTTCFKNRENIILAIGTLTHNKNFIDLINAARILKTDLQNWQIHIYGEGEQKAFLQNKIEEYDLVNFVKLKGFCYDMSEIYNNAKILISTSLSEGFGRTLTEALSYQIPVIAYNCKCGPKEIVSNDVNGFLIDFDSSQLADKLRELITNPEKLQTFSDHTYDDIHKFDYENIMKQWVGFYKEIFIRK